MTKLVEARSGNVCALVKGHVENNTPVRLRGRGVGEEVVEEYVREFKAFGFIQRPDRESKT